MFLANWLSGGPSLSPEEQIKAWKDILRKERLELESQRRGFDRTEAEAQREVKGYLKIGERKAASILAGGIVLLRRARERTLMIEMQLKSVELQLTRHAAASKMSQALQRSADAMKAMNSLVKIPQLAQTAKMLSVEMAKAGFIEESLDDILGDGEGEEDIEEAANEEVDRILQELAEGLVLPSAPHSTSTAPLMPAGLVEKLPQKDASIPVGTLGI